MPIDVEKWQTIRFRIDALPAPRILAPVFLIRFRGFPLRADLCAQNKNLASSTRFSFPGVPSFVLFSFTRRWFRAADGQSSPSKGQGFSCPSRHRAVWTRER